MSRREACDFSYGGPWACISIATEDGHWPDIQHDEGNILRLAFADVLVPVEGFPFFDREHAHEILDFVTRFWDSVDVMMVHCEAGVSRSAAVAAAVSRLKGLDPEEFFAPPYFPNEVVYQTIMEVGSGRGDYQG